MVFEVADIYHFLCQIQSTKTSISIHQLCSWKDISQVTGLAVMERSGDLSLPQVYFLFSSFWGTVSCDVKTGPQHPLHHGRHLNPFPLLAFYTTFTAAQVFNTDQSLLLFCSFITTSFLLFFSLHLILFSFTCIVACPHSLLFFTLHPAMLLPLLSCRLVYLSPPLFFLSSLFPLFPPLCFPPPPSFVFIICWRVECGRMLVICWADCIGHAWMIPNLVPNILSLWVMTLIITNGGWWISGNSWVFYELHHTTVVGALKGNWISFVVPV